MNSILKPKIGILFLNLILGSFLCAPSFAEDGPIVRRPRRPAPTEPTKPAPSKPTPQKPSEPIPAPPLPDQPPVPDHPPVPAEPPTPDQTPSSCFSTKDLSFDCVVELTDARESLVLIDQGGYLNPEYFGAWNIRQIYKAEGSGFKKLRGINGDGSRSGPMELHAEESRFYNWGNAGGTFGTSRLRPLGIRSFEIHLQDSAMFSNDNMILECVAPTDYQGRKIICTWSRENRRGEVEFRGYIDLERARQR